MTKKNLQGNHQNNPINPNNTLTNLFTSPQNLEKNMRSYSNSTPPCPPSTTYLAKTIKINAHEDHWPLTLAGITKTPDDSVNGTPLSTYQYRDPVRFPFMCKLKSATTVGLVEHNGLFVVGKREMTYNRTTNKWTHIVPQYPPEVKKPYSKAQSCRANPILSCFVNSTPVYGNSF